jgi:hypothetical protein
VCESTSLRTALLMFVAFGPGTGAATAAGRLRSGRFQALSERYTTPVLMAWLDLVTRSEPALLPSYPDADRAMTLARRTADVRLTVFAEVPYAGCPPGSGRSRTSGSCGPVWA